MDYKVEVVVLPVTDVDRAKTFYQGSGVAALAVHLMTNTAVTSATYDIDGGEQVLPGS